MVSKTRDKLIDVARRLFARQGVENTTMNDIAEASEKGRRTVYTYFKNKRDIYDAVIEQESESLLTHLREVVDLSIPPLEKLEKYLHIRFEVLTQLGSDRPGFWSLFTPDGRKVARTRKMAQEKERELFRRVIDEGVQSGAFDPVQARLLPKIESFLFQTIGMAGTRADLDASETRIHETRDALIEFIINGVRNNQ